jgi:hypothetical protein
MSWLLFTANLPPAWARAAGEDDAVGLTDIGLRVMFQPFSATARRYKLETGMQVELPTGSVEGGVGGGHVALIPTARGPIRATKAVEVHGELFVASSLGAHAHAPGSWHSMLAIHELAARLTTRYIDERFTVGTGLSTLQGLSGPRTELGDRGRHGHAGRPLEGDGRLRAPLRGRAPHGLGSQAVRRLAV